MVGLDNVEDAASGEGRMLLISWNAAGWSSTHSLIRAHYDGLANYLEGMGRPAVFCVQETKVQSKLLKNEAAAKDLGAVLTGYRSFWAFNEDKDPQRAHLQGVATWVRNDIDVIAATQRVFGDSSLDPQGRVLLTDHGSFAVLNVYLPFVGSAGEGTETHYKWRYLQGLERVMKEMIAQGKRVILCGDMNLTRRLSDQKPWRRLLQSDEAGRIHVYLPASLVEDLSSIVVAAKKFNTQQEPNAGSCPSKDLPITAMLGPFSDWAGQWVPVKDVAERTQLPADALAAGAECMHIVEKGCVPWFRRLVEPEGRAPWADVFAEVHPTATDRFTSWGQSTNLRYKNTGTRIDYVLADRDTFERAVVRSSSEELPGGISRRSSDTEVDKSGDVGVASTSAEAAANAATHFNGWHAAATMGLARGDGLSFQADDMRLNNTQFPAKPYTGLIYTPPSYSDHIPVSVLFTHELRNPLSNADTLTARKPWRDNLTSHTKQAQPWRFQPSIGAFFGGSRVLRTDPSVGSAVTTGACKSASSPVTSTPTKSTPNNLPLTVSAASVVESKASNPEKLSNTGAVTDSAAGKRASIEFANTDSPSGMKLRDAQKDEPCVVKKAPLGQNSAPKRRKI